MTSYIHSEQTHWQGEYILSGAPRAQRRCGVCRETGHDRRRCPMALIAVEETPKKIRWSKTAKGRKKIKSTPPPPKREVYRVAVIASRDGERLKNEEDGDIGLSYCWDGEFIYTQGWFGKEEKICSYENFRAYRDYKNGDYDKYDTLDILLDELDWSEHLKMIGHWEKRDGLLWQDYSIAIKE